MQGLVSVKGLVKKRMVNLLGEEDMYEPQEQPVHRMLKKLLWSTAREIFMSVPGCVFMGEQSFRIASDALDWVMLPNQDKIKDDNRFLYEEVCEELGLNPEVMRGYVREECKRKGLHLEKLSSY